MIPLLLAAAGLGLATHFIPRLFGGGATPSPRPSLPPPAPPSPAPVVVAPPPSLPAPVVPTVPTQPVQARDVGSLAAAVAADVRAKGRNYDRNLVRHFQQLAPGLAVDGIYGPQTAGAVRHFSAQAVPPPTGGGIAVYPPAQPPRPAVQPQSAPPTAPRPATPPAAPAPAQDARSLATAVAADVRSKGRNYDRNLVRRFQQLAPGLAVDGVYGPQTAGAVRHFSGQVVSPPAGGAIATYPPAQAPQPVILPPQSSPPAAPRPAAPPAAPAPAQVQDARSLAMAVAADVRGKGRNYDRNLVRRFQQLAPGLAVDGVYGPQTAGAVRHFSGHLVSPPAGGGIAAYPPAQAPRPTPQAPAQAPAPRPTPQAQAAPPAGAGANYQVKDRQRLDGAAVLANAVLDQLRQRGTGYDRAIMRRFQQAAGLAVDGLYGPKTAGAIKWYTGQEVAPHTGKGFAAYLPNF